MHERLAFAVAFAFALAVAALPACTKTDPLYCDENTPCEDPERPVCDLEGEYPESEGIKRTCIADPDFAIALADGDAQVRIGGELALEVTLDRKASFPTDVTVIVDGLPAGASAEPLTIPADSSAGTLLIQAANSDPGDIADARVIASAGPLERTADLRLLVLGPAGSLDPTFGTLGLAAEPPSTTDDATGLAQLPDGSLIVVGATFAGDTGAMLRYSSEGELDTSFGVDGVKAIDLSPDGIEIRLPFRVAQQSDGKVIVAVGSETGDLALLRYTADGDLDPDFGSDGLVRSVVTTIPIGLGAVATGPDDEIVVGVVVVGGSDMISVVRFSREGVRDESFAGGRLDFDRGTGHSIGATRVLGNGSVVISGKATNEASDRIPFVARFTPQGSVDETFGDGGVVEFDLSASPNVVLQLENGDLVIAGNIATGGTPPNVPTLWRLTSSGDLDPGFGANGEVKADGVNGGVADLVETGDGMIAVAYFDITLIRLDPSTGELDQTFGDGGITALPLVEGFAKRAVRRSDQRFVVLADDDSFQFVLARFFE